MPLSEKGREIMANMKKQYGEKKGEQVFYASKNKGTIEGVDSGALLARLRARRGDQARPTHDVQDTPLQRLQDGLTARFIAKPPDYKATLDRWAARAADEEATERRQFTLGSIRDALAKSVPIRNAISDALDAWSPEARKAARRAR